MIDLKALLKQMTIEEKIGQLTQYNANLFINTTAEITGPLSSAGLEEGDVKVIGSVLNFKNAQEVTDIQNKHMEEDRNKIPLMFMMDVVHGYKTIYPIPLALGCSFDTGIVEECTEMAAKEASSAGVQVTFAPMVDYARDARWGRVMETCSEEPMINALMGAVQVKAFQKGDISHKDSLATCVKHFAAYGGAEAGRDYNSVDVSEHAMHEYYLPAYKACLDAGADLIMTSFNTVNGVPAIANKWLMKEILKEKWKSDVPVITDYNAIEELILHGVAGDKKDAARLAFENGCHIEMCSSTYINHLKDLIEEGVFSEKQLDDAVLKVLELKDRLGLFEDPLHGASLEREKAVCLTKENRAVARRAARECAVLLKNENVLPIDKSVKKIALIGPFADNHEINGWWSCQGSPSDTVSVKQGIEAMLPESEIEYVKACENVWDDTDKSNFKSAIDAAKNADCVILCLGENHRYSGEANSRVDIDLPGVQNDLAKEIAKVNSNVVAVLFTGRPLAVKNLCETVPAVLNMWFPGTEGGNAVADLIFGDANPCGKLTMSFPQSVGQCPIYYNHLNTGRPKPMDMDDKRLCYFTGYVDSGNLPLYSFGYGLSYSDFVYEGLVLSKSRFNSGEEVFADVTIYNNSDVFGKETVMLYMRDVVASVARPVQQLIAFEKIGIEARERKTVRFTISEEMLRFWNGNNEFVSEPGEFHISTGYADHLLFTSSLFLD